MRSAKRNSRVVKTSITTVLVLGLLVAQTIPALAAQLPDPSSNLFLQTSGPNAGISIGDYYTSPGGGNTDHLFNLHVPSNWPTGQLVTVSLYDPELAGPNPSSPPASDEVRGSADSATFRLESPSGSTIATATYSDASTNGLWVELATFDPGMTGTGVFELHVSTSDDDDNSWRVDASHDPDCVVGGPGNCSTALLQNGNETNTAPGGSGPLALAVVRTSYQHSGSGNVCLDHVFYVNSSTPRPLRAHNFDMDGNGSVAYTTPTGTNIVGTLSGNGKWNGSSDTTRVGDVLPDINGWWTAEICISPTNQYVFEAPSAGPSFPVPQPSPRLTIEKDDGVDVAHVGDVLSYTITISNVSDGDSYPGDAYQVTATDVLPEGVSFLSCTAPAGFSCNEATGTVMITADSVVAPGASAAIDILVEVDPYSPVSVANEITVEYEDHLGNPQPSGFADDTDDIEFTPMLTLHVSGPASVLRGDTASVTYSLSHHPSSDGSPISSPGIVCDVCASATYVSGDDNTDGVLDEGETWTYEATIPTDGSTPDPHSISVDSSGLDATNESVQTNLTHDIDILEPGSLAGTVFEDLDGDGLHDPGEPGIDVAPVLLSDDTSPISSIYPTGGDYAFTHLGASSFQVTVDATQLPEGMVATSTQVQNVALQEGEDADGLDFGYAFPATVSGIVFVDSDLSGSHQVGEEGLHGVEISLSDDSGIVATSNTASDGSYQFAVLPGIYTLTVTGGTPSGWSFTTAEDLVLGLVASGATSSGNDFGLINHPPTATDVMQEIEQWGTPDPLNADDVENTEVIFSVLSGDLPAGLTLNNDGIFAGQSDEAGEFGMVVGICDSGDPSACNQFSLTLMVADEVQDLTVLPFTGIDLESLVLIGLLLVLGGGGLVLFEGRDEEAV